nr:MAG TPA: hypothetical protein [Caudoviricetes sp.]
MNCYTFRHFDIIHYFPPLYLLPIKVFKSYYILIVYN